MAERSTDRFQRRRYGYGPGRQNRGLLRLSHYIDPDNPWREVAEIFGSNVWKQGFTVAVGHRPKASVSRVDTADSPPARHRSAMGQT